MAVSKELKGSRERILTAALDEFAELGLAGARVDRIAEKAGINKAMIYYHFDSKEALYDHVLGATIEAGVTDISKEIGEDMSLEDVLRTIARYHARGLRANDRITRILLRELAAGGERMQSILANLAGKEDLRALIVRMIEEGKRSGIYRDVDIRHALISFAGMSVFYLMMAPMVNQLWGIENETEFIEQRTDAMVDLFMHGLKTR
jgi:AcrR family transcriptional regulator